MGRTTKIQYRRGINTLLLFCFFSTNISHAEGLLELKTTIIKSNKEFPQLMYLVPWQETRSVSRKEVQKLKLHSLFGDLFDPLLPEKISDMHADGRHTLKAD